MEAILTKLVGAVKYTAKLFVIVAIISSILLFSPSSFINRTGLAQFIVEYNSYIWFAFLIAGVVTLVNLFHFIYSWLVNRLRLMRVSKFRIKRLQSLNLQEKEILLYYFSNYTNTQSLPINDGTVAELEAYQVISRTSQLSHGGAVFPYNLNPWARKYLSKHTDLLDISLEEAEILKRTKLKEPWLW